MIQPCSTVTRWSLFLALSYGGGLIQATAPELATGQVLDRQVEQLLGNNCTGLLGAPADDVDSLEVNLKLYASFLTQGRPARPAEERHPFKARPHRF